MCGAATANTAISTQTLNNWMAAWRGSDRLLKTFEHLASKEALAVGIEIIDNQHKSIFAMANNLFDAKEYEL